MSLDLLLDRLSCRSEPKSATSNRRSARRKFCLHPIDLNELEFGSESAVCETERHTTAVAAAVAVAALAMLFSSRGRQCARLFAAPKICYKPRSQSVGTTMRTNIILLYQQTDRYPLFVRKHWLVLKRVSQCLFGARFGRSSSFTKRSSR